MEFKNGPRYRIALSKWDTAPFLWKFNTNVLAVTLEVLQSTMENLIYIVYPYDIFYPVDMNIYFTYNNHENGWRQHFVESVSFVPALHRLIVFLYHLTPPRADPAIEKARSVSAVLGARWDTLSLDVLSHWNNLKMRSLWLICYRLDKRKLLIKT